MNPTEPNQSNSGAAVVTEHSPQALPTFPPTDSSHPSAGVASGAKQQVDVPFVIFLVIASNMLIIIASLVIADIQLGVLNGEAETGWGMVIAFFFFLPIFLVFSVISFIRAIMLKSRGRQISRSLKYGVLLSILSFLMDPALFIALLF